MEINIRKNLNGWPIRIMYFRELCNRTKRRVNVHLFKGRKKKSAADTSLAVTEQCRMHHETPRAICKALQQTALIWVLITFDWLQVHLGEAPYCPESSFSIFNNKQTYALKPNHMHTNTHTHLIHSTASRFKTLSIVSCLLLFTTH